MSGIPPDLRYASPLVPEFRGADFRKRAKHWGPRVAAAIADGAFRPPRREWPWAESTRRRPFRPWGPKIYVCVSSRDYWPCVDALVRAFPGREHKWKFAFGPYAAYERPDKIVFYADSPAAARSLTRRLRRVVAKMTPRPLDHARPTAGLWEGPGARGLYVACDPNFLRTSWRLYRVITLAWAAKNAEYLSALPGGESRWLRRMNVSREHGGPESLSQNARDRAYARRYWRMIVPPGAKAW